MFISYIITTMATLNKLLTFVPENDEERAIFDSLKKSVLTEYLIDSKSSWSKGQFYLGGFIKMNPDEEITLKKFDEVKKMREKRYIEYGGPCNSAEMASIWRSERQLSEIEIIVKKYEEIYKLRVEKELLKIQSLNNDVTTSIVSFI
jgi:hypothetical protein